MTEQGTLMTWNYRVILCNGAYQFHEVYYHSDGSICGWTGPIAPLGDTLEELVQDMRYMALAINKPALTIEEDEQGNPTLKEAECETTQSENSSGTTPGTRMEASSST